MLTHLYKFSRNSSDLDILVIVGEKRLAALAELAREFSKLHDQYGVYLDCVTVGQGPYNYEDRLTEMYAGVFKYLRLFALDPYDLALSKLERNEQIDRDDVKHLARSVPLDLDLLRKRYKEELRPYLGRPAREDNTLRFWIETIEEERAKSPLP